MSLFLESIAVKNRKLQHLSWHNERLNLSLRKAGKQKEVIELSEHIVVPKELGPELHKCRVVYDHKIRQVEWILYHPKKIRSLKLIEANEIEYDFKYKNRRSLLELFALRGQCDDILIVKNGWITDSSYCNIAFWDGNQWLTPHAPLLPGTCRARLLAEGIIQEAEIEPGDLPSFSRIRLMNALLGWSAANEVLHVL